MEFMSDGSVGVFASVPLNNGSRFTFRDEYILFNNWPVTDVDRKSQFDLVKYDAVGWISNQTLVANATLHHRKTLSRMKCAFIYDFGESSFRVSKFKFSVHVYSTMFFASLGCSLSD